MDRVAVFVARYFLANSPSILNLLDFLSRRFEVSLFLRKVHLRQSPILDRDTIQVTDVGDRFSWSHFRAKRRNAGASFRHLIAIDPHGFVLCRDLFPEARAIYYSLELYVAGDHPGLFYPKSVMRKEREAIHGIRGFVIQSEEKERIFRDDYGLDTRIPSFRLPVTCRGPSVRERGTYLRDRYGIGVGRKIALCLGGIADAYGSIEIALQYSTMPDWVLVFHGQRVRKYVERLEAILRVKGIGNVIVSDEFYESLEETDKILMSADLGIAWYKDISSGFRTVGRSSGKIATYMKFGLPTIATRYPSTIEAIERPGVGVCIERFDEIPEAVCRIERDRACFSENAWREYERTYRFESYESGLGAFLESAR